MNSFLACVCEMCGMVVAMGNQTNKKNDAIRELLERYDEAADNIKKATKKLREVEGAIRQWIGDHVGPIYDNWTPKVGDVAVYIVMSEASRYAYRLRVHELRGRYVVFTEEDNPDVRVRFDLEHYEKYFAAEGHSESVELIVPSAVYDQEVRHWFGLQEKTHER